MAVMRQPIEGTLGENGIVEERRPLIDRAVRGHDGGRAFVALDDDFVEVARLLRRQSAKAEIIDNQEIGRQEGA